jgi:hypothetical protein
MYEQEKLLSSLSLAQWTEEEKFKVGERLQKSADVRLLELIRQNAIGVIARKNISALSLVEDKNSFLSELKSELDKDFQRFQVQFKSRESHVKLILHACSRENIPVILLKGSAFGESLYHQFSYKKMNDVDLLIPFQDVPRFIVLIKTLGFQSAGALFAGEEISKNNHHTSPYYSSDHLCLLGIHWGLCSPFARWKIPTSDLWTAAVPMACLGESCLRLRWEHSLLHLCCHLPFYKIGTRELADVINLIRQNSLDWNFFLTEMRRWHAEDAVYRVLSLSNALVPLEIPEEILSTAKLQASTLTCQDTDLRVRHPELLAQSRSTYVGKIEKAYSISRLSRNGWERSLAWFKTWQMTFLVPEKEALKICGVLPSASRFKRIAARLRAPLLVQKAMARDYGWQLFVIITVLNVMNGLWSFIQGFWQFRNPWVIRSKEFKIYQNLE